MTEMVQRGIVLAASSFDFENKTGDEVKGTTVHAIMTTSLAPHQDAEKPIKGYRPAKFRLPVETFETKIVDVPGLYDFNMTVEVMSDGKMKATPFDLTFIKSLQPKVKP